MKSTKIKQIQIHAWCIYIPVLVFAFSLFASFSTDEKVAELQKYCLKNYGTKHLTDFIYVSINEQKLYFIQNEKIVDSYPVSTSKFGTGSLANTNRTPIGLHYVRDKQGYNTPMNGILESGQYKGNIATIEYKAVDHDSDQVTTRVLWLMGCEHGLNRGKEKDSYCRMIYIHGTPEEGLIGRPASHGCVRMRNADVLDLFNKTELGLYVLIR